MTKPKISTFLMFTGQAEEAMKLYTTLFEGSAIQHVHHNEDGTIMHATFNIKGQSFMCIDSQPVHAFTFTPSISLYVNCDTEEEIDRVFETLSRDGQILMPLGAYPFSEKFVWLNDKYGVSWQLSLARPE
ncbi:VOC family protein [Paenibacillus hodogayensis]|uniref:VOC family protein n=1 Tax=Paenibacillus hodogayensis TaxID=279208 RepID=A0ABV5W2Y1_9BACL